jgi:FkbM family methyltransferase
MRNFMFSVFIKVYHWLCGTGAGKLPLAGWANDFLYDRLKPRGSAALVEAQGYKIYLNPQDIGFSRMLFMYGHYEKYTTDVFRKLVKRGDVFLDIGANLGHYTLIAAKLIGESGRVHAFEPAADNYTLLVKSVAANGFKNIVTVPKAVSNRNGTTRLILDPHEAGMHRLASGSDSGESAVIETVTLDDYFKDKEKRVDIMKMDVEGAEMLVLEGMREILERSNDLTIFTEFSPVMIRRAGSAPEEYLRQLFSRGFALFHINEQEEKLVPLDFDKAMRIGTEEKWTNFLCLKDRARKELGL